MTDDAQANAPMRDLNSDWANEMYAKQSSVEVFGQRIVDTWRGGGHDEIGGLLMHWQAPGLSRPQITAEAGFLMRMVPSTMRRRRILKHPGDPMPSFSLPGTDGSTLTSDGLRGASFAMRLTRTVASGVI
jgi:hypothetical protein